MGFLITIKKQLLKPKTLVPVAVLCSCLILSGCSGGSSGKTAGTAQSSDHGSESITGEAADSASTDQAQVESADTAQAASTDTTQATSGDQAQAASASQAKADSADTAQAASVDTTQAESVAGGNVTENNPATGSSTVSTAAGSTAKGPGSTAQDTGSTAAESVSGENVTENEGSGRRLLKYIDAWDEWHTMEVDPAVSPNIYDPERFVYDKESGQMTYTASKASGTINESTNQSESYEVLQGVDISEHQGYIDWNAVADAGYQFAFIRVGYRGYGEAGNVFEDATAVDNLQAAKAAGMQVGAYFFSQALSADEAREEASVALGVIEQSGISLDLPLMYDPEIIKDDWGRANDITRDQVAVNTAAFRDAVESSSPWKVDIYSNLPWEHNYFDTDTMNQYEIWYADYERTPQTPYHFVWWQYTNEGYVPGIQGRVDLNLWMRPVGPDDTP